MLREWAGCGETLCRNCDFYENCRFSNIEEEEVIDNVSSTKVNTREQRELERNT